MGSLCKSMMDFSDEYIRCYCDCSNVEKYEIFKYLPIGVVRRLYDNITCGADISKHENEWLKDIIFSC